jgi:uncharacterized protein (TIGR02118 family)
MYKLVILIKQNLEDPLFQENWPAFLSYAERMPGLQREATSHVDHVLFGDYPYTLIHELFFASAEDLQKAMASPEGREAGRILQTISQGQLTLYSGGHAEDAAENLAKYRKQPKNEQP